jgi:site-specific recombinase XerD
MSEERSKYNQSVQKIQQPLDALPSSVDPDRLIDVYLQRYDRPETKRSYRSDLVDFFGTDEVDISLAAGMSFVHINQYIASLEALGRKASTIRRRIAALRGFYDWLHALGAIEKNPAHKQLVRRVKFNSNKDRPIFYLTAKQAADLIAATSEAGEAAVRNRALIVTMLHCVLRRSEAAAMDVEHVRPIGHYWVLDLPTTKGGADQYVKVPSHVVEEIDTHRNHYGIDSGPLWRSHAHRNKGGRLSTRSIYNIVSDTAMAAGLSEVGAHTLRHTGCTLAIEAGASLQQVQSHARHKNIETTMVYIHQRDRLRDSAADFIHIDSDPDRNE